MGDMGADLEMPEMPEQPEMEEGDEEQEEEEEEESEEKKKKKRKPNKEKGKKKGKKKNWPEFATELENLKLKEFIQVFQQQNLTDSRIWHMIDDQTLVALGMNFGHMQK